MKWKIYLTAFISLVAVSMPANIIGCGPDSDPYDYYTSFFNTGLTDVKGYMPFYYTSYGVLYGADDSEDPTTILANEWAAYCGSKVTAMDAGDFVIGYSIGRIDSLLNLITNKKATKNKTALPANSMENYFLQHKDPEALTYIRYAKKAGPYVTGGGDSWEAVVRDSAAMDQLIQEGQQLYSRSKKDFFKLKYGYQITRLAHYSNRYTDAILFYDQYIANNKTSSILQAMSLSLKAGALLHLGKNEEAAYLFSKAFNDNQVRRVSNYFGFKWSTVSVEDPQSYLALCKNNKEKANMIALFSFGDTRNRLASLKEIYRLDPGNKVLEVLATREINKLEETYFTQKIARQPGGLQFFYSWQDATTAEVIATQKTAVIELAAFLDTIAQNKNSSNPALFETGAAYTFLMLQDYKHAKKYIDAANEMHPVLKVKDQLLLTQLLLTINSRQIIDAAFEEEILPAVKWLQQKAEDERKDQASSIHQWTLFYRNLMSSILAKKYHVQGDYYKEVLAVGAADRGTQDSENYYSYTSMNFLYSKLVSKEVEKIYDLMNSKTRNKFEDYLVNFNSIKINDVINFAGTAYLRDYNFSSAINWFKKDTATNKDPVTSNPFIELLYDQEEQLPGEQLNITKQDFAKEMLRLESLIKTDKLHAAKYYYKMALGFYNITYYGHAWQLTAYERSGSDGYKIPKDANAFQKEYYGCFTAHDYFKKARDASVDKNFKGKCLFMMAKCAQKQIRQPQYEDFPGNYDDYDAASKKYQQVFMNNKYFPLFIREYKNTAFYKEAFNSCSYLRDFIHKK